MNKQLPRLWYGKKRLAKRLVREGTSYTRLLRWGLTIKPGDYIATCEGTNRKVAEVEIEWKNEGRWRRGKPNKTWFLFEIVFTDTRGGWHYCPGGGCSSPAEPPEVVNRYLTNYALQQLTPEGRQSLEEWTRPEDLPKVLERLARTEQAIKEGRPLVDEFGEILPEFDRLTYF